MYDLVLLPDIPGISAQTSPPVQFATRPPPDPTIPTNPAWVDLKHDKDIVASATQANNCKYHVYEATRLGQIQTEIVTVGFDVRVMIDTALMTGWGYVIGPGGIGAQHTNVHYNVVLVKLSKLFRWQLQQAVRVIDEECLDGKKNHRENPVGNPLWVELQPPLDKVDIESVLANNWNEGSNAKNQADQYAKDHNIPRGSDSL